MGKILVVGSLGYDTILTEAGRVEEAIGGSANYFSLSAALFSPVKVVGVVGEDYRDEDFQLLASRNVDISAIRVEKGKTFRWAGSYVQDLNEAVTLKTELNVFRDFNPDVPTEARGTDYVFLANIDPVLQMRVLDQMQNPKMVALDTMNFWINSKRAELLEAISRVRILFLNEKEALALSGEKQVVHAVEALHKFGPEIIVVKRGEYGFFMFSKGRYFVLPAVPVTDVVDPTGAGDTFAGGFFGYLAALNREPEWSDLQQACVYGTILASYTVQDFSVRALTRLNRTMVEARLRDYLSVVTLPRPWSEDVVIATL